MIGFELPVPLGTSKDGKKKYKIVFRMNPSGGLSAELKLGKLRGRIGFNPKTGFYVTGGAKSLKKKAEK